MEIQTRRRGRPRAFDADAALERATRLFWIRGFSATSVAELGAELGLSPPSMYAAWQSKEALFCQCLNRYSETAGARPLDGLRASRSLTSGLSEFFKRLLAEYASDAEPRGCFLVAAMAEASALPLEARKIIDRLRLQRQAELEQVALAAKGRGELAAGVDPKLYAALIASFGLALNIKARAGVPRRELAREAKLLHAILLAVAGGAIVRP